MPTKHLKKKERAHKILANLKLCSQPLALEPDLENFDLIISEVVHLRLLENSQNVATILQVWHSHSIVEGRTNTSQLQRIVIKSSRANNQQFMRALARLDKRDGTCEGRERVDKM